MHFKLLTRACLIILLLNSVSIRAQVVEINGSPFATEGAPLPAYHKTGNEKMILVDPRNHLWGAYRQNGRLLRWGIATTGSDTCPEGDGSCRTSVGSFRVYTRGDENCQSQKYNNAPMPYCMYFNGGQALHGSSDIHFANKSHGCVRVHLDDAKWLHDHFVELPNNSNGYRGTIVQIMPY